MKFDELFKEPVDGFTSDKRKRVGGYILGRTLGEGSFAKVRQGTHLLTREKVAVKVINKRLVNRREYVRKNMRREAVMLQRLRHPNIVQLFEVLETDHTFYLVTELADGGDFMKYLNKRKQLSESEARHYLRQIVSAVEHMHRSGVIHRDLKIENLLLDKDMNIKIIGEINDFPHSDLGLSNVLDSHSLLTTQCGSPAYAAPEIFSKEAYGPSVDVWSIGINLYAMVTGRLPFLVDPPNNLTKLHSLILRGCKVPTNVSPGCQDLLMHMLEPKPHKRLSIREVMLHPWLNEGHPQLALWPLKARIPHDQVKELILKYMTSRLDIGENTLKESIMHHKPNSMAATYHLLCIRFDKGLGLPPSSSSGVPLGRSEEVVRDLKKDEEDRGAGSASRKKHSSGQVSDTVDSTDGVLTVTGYVKQEEEEDRINPLYIPEVTPIDSAKRTASRQKLDGLLNQRPSNYKECLRQLKQQREMPRQSILKPGSGKSEHYRGTVGLDEAKYVQFSEKQLETAQLTPSDVERISDHYMVQSMNYQRETGIGMSPSPTGCISSRESSSHHRRALLQHRRWSNEQYGSPPAPPNSALGHNRTLPSPGPSVGTPVPSSASHTQCLPKHPPAVLTRDSPSCDKDDEQFYDGYRFKARTLDGERAVSWKLKPFRIRSRSGYSCSSRTSSPSRQTAGSPASRLMLDTRQRKLGSVPGQQDTSRLNSDAVELSRLGVSYTVPDHCSTLTQTRPRKQPGYPAATAYKWSHGPSPRQPPSRNLFSPKSAYRHINNRASVT